MEIEPPGLGNLCQVLHSGGRGTRGGSGAPALSSIYMYMKRDDRKNSGYKPQPYTTIIPSWIKDGAQPATQQAYWQLAPVKVNVKRLRCMILSNRTKHAYLANYNIDDTNA